MYLGSVESTLPLQRLQAIGTPSPDPPGFLSQLGAFDDLLALDVHDGGVPYDLVPFWSDGARKQRWLFLPNDGLHDQPGEQIVFSESDNWGFPVGSVLMKHFELPLDETDPSITTRLETRFLVHGEAGDWYGVTYRWDPDQSDARLLLGQESADYTIQEAGGGTGQQTWVNDVGIEASGDQTL